jgi:hypothetical protein
LQNLQSHGNLFLRHDENESAWEYEEISVQTLIFIRRRICGNLKNINLKVEMEENLLNYIPSGPATCEYRRLANLNYRLQRRNIDIISRVFYLKASKVRIFAELKLRQLLKSSGMMADKKTYLTWMSNLTNDILLSEAVTARVQGCSGSPDDYSPSADGDSDEFIYETLDAYSIELPSFKENFDSTAPQIVNDSCSLYAISGSGHGVPVTCELESTEKNQMNENKGMHWTKKEMHDDHLPPSAHAQSEMKGECRSTEELNEAIDIKSIAVSLEDTPDDKKLLIENLINFVPSTNDIGRYHQQKRIGEDVDLSAYDDCSFNDNESSSTISATTSAARNRDPASNLPHSAITVPAKGTRSVLTTGPTTESRCKGDQADNSKISEVNFSGSWYPSSTPVMMREMNLPRHNVDRGISFCNSGIIDSPLSAVDAASRTCARSLQRQMSSDPFLCSPDTIIPNTDPPPSSATSMSAPTRNYHSMPSARESVDLSSITFQVIPLPSPHLPYPPLSSLIFPPLLFPPFFYPPLIFFPFLPSPPLCLTTGNDVLVQTSL